MPKRKHDVDATDDPNVLASVGESKRLQDLAFDHGILSSTRRISAATLPPTNMLVKADGKDIVKRSSARKTRYLMVFNCQLAPAAAGRLGTLTGLDSRNPRLYIEFPEGRLRLSGTLIFPHNKYLVVRMGNKEVLCEDVLESVIIFSEAHWVGTPEQNPEEIPLAMPDNLALQRRHTKYSFDNRGSGGEASKAAERLGTSQRHEDEPEDEDDGVAAMSAENGTLSQQLRRTKRSRGAKRQRYAEDSDANITSEDESSDEHGDVMVASDRKFKRAGQMLPARVPGTGGPFRTAVQTKPKAHPIEIDLALDGSDDDNGSRLAQTQEKLGAKSATNKAANVRESRRGNSPENYEEIDLISVPAAEFRQVDGGDGNDAMIDEQEEQEEEDFISHSQRPRRCAAKTANKKLRTSPDSEEQNDDDNNDADDSDDEVSFSENEASEDESEEYEASE